MSRPPMYRDGFHPMEGRKTPIHQASVIQNCRLDKAEIQKHKTISEQAGNANARWRALYPGAKSDDLFFTPFEQEIVITKRTSGVAASNVMHDPSLYVLPSANVLCERVEAGIEPNSELARAYVRQQWRFAGVVNKGVDLVQGNHLRGQNTEFTSILGGTCPLNNAGYEPIRAGDPVVWDMPDPQRDVIHREGQPKGKLFFATRPFDPSNEALNSSLLKLLDRVDPANPLTIALTEPHRGGVGGPLAEVSVMKAIGVRRKNAMDAFKNFLHVSLGHLDKLEDAVDLNLNDKKDLQRLFAMYWRLVAEQRQRVIGRALTSADVGGQFTIQVGSYCCVV